MIHLKLVHCQFFYSMLEEDIISVKISGNSSLCRNFLTLTRPIGLPPHTPVAQKIADQRELIPSLAKNKYLFYKLVFPKMRIKNLRGSVRSD